MKRKQSKIRIIIFYCMILVPSLIWILLSVCGATEALDYDTGENRNKHEFSEDTNITNVTSEAEAYFDDRVAFRSVLLSINSGLNYVLEAPYNGLIKPGLLAIANAALGDEADSSAGTDESSSESTDSSKTDDSLNSSDSKTSSDKSETATDSKDTSVSSESSTDSKETSASSESSTDSVESTDTSDVPAIPTEPYYETPTESGYYPYTVYGDMAIQGRDGWLFCAEDMPDVQGTSLRSDENLQQTVSLMQQVNDECEALNTELYYIAVPNKSEVYSEYMPTIDDASDYSAVDQLNDYIEANTDLNFDYLLDGMLCQKSYGTLYHPTDTHWNARGAVAGLTLIHQILGLEPINVSILPEEITEYTTGDLISYTGLPSSAFSDEGQEYAYKKGNTMYFQRGQDDILDEYLTAADEGSTDALDPRTVCVIGDSYRNNLVSYLSKDFAHTYYLNQAAIETEDTKEIIADSDIVIFLMVERNYQPNANFGVALDALNTVLS